MINMSIFSFFKKKKVKPTLNVETEELTEKPSMRLKGKNVYKFSKDCTIIDIETTGIVPSRNQIIEIAALKIKDFKIAETFNSFIHRNKKLRKETIKLTGITDDMLKDAPTLENVMENFLSFIDKDILVGHNVNFDINFLYENALKTHNHVLNNDYIDTLYLAKNILPFLDNYKLSTLSNYYKLSLAGHHRALADCHLCFNCYINLQQDYLQKSKAPKQKEAIS